MTALLGLLLGLFAGVMAGSFSLPMKKTTRWSWEATWLIWSICALLIIPWGIAMITIPDIMAVLAGASTMDMVLVCAFGAGWGLGAVFFGQSIAMIGISLAFALCIGLATALGTLIPMLRDPKTFTTSGGMWSTAGIVVMLIGVSICSAAGRRKEQQLQQGGKVDTQKNQAPRDGAGGRMVLGLILAALGGIFSSMLNLAFNFSQSIKDAALACGATEISASDPVWALTLFGGLLTNIVYCSILLSRNKTWGDYRKKGTLSYWFLAAMMGAIWMPSVALYGRAAVMMGKLGGSAGWGLYMGMVIIISNVWGFVTGEWRGVSGKPIRLMIMGSGLLLVSIVLIGYATTLKEYSYATQADTIVRYGSVIGVREEKIAEYKKLHAATWPDVLKMIKECNIRNYSIYLRKLDDGNCYLFSYFEYAGENFDADMARMAADPTIQKWWSVCKPCQKPLENRAETEWWSGMEEVFHCD